MKLKRVLPSILRLRQKWRAFGMMAVVFARALLRPERAGGWDARRHADDLELRLRVAVFEINADIAEIEEAAPPQTEDEADALEHLRVIVLNLLGLLLFVREMKARLPNKGSAMFAYEGYGGAASRTLALTAQLTAPARLDGG